MPDLAILIIQNVLVVSISITIFIGVFYFAFLFTARRGFAHDLTINHKLELFFESKYANYLVFTWAAAEAVVWFVIPEFLLLLVLFMRPHRKYQLLIYDILGTAVGTIIALALHFPKSTLVNLPYIYPSMITQVEKWYSELGIFGLVHQPFSGVPYKVFTHTAPDFHFFIPLFILFAVIVRVSRYFIAFSILQALFPLLHRYIYRNYIALAIIATIIFSLLLLRVSLTYS